MQLFKIVLLFSLLIPTLTLAKSKEKPKPTTQLEAFYAKKGMVVVREIYPVGYVFHQKRNGGYMLYVKAVVLYIPGRQDKVIKGIKVDLISLKTRGTITSSYIDSTEIPSLYKAIMYMVKMAPRVKRSNVKTDLMYITSGEFRIGIKHVLKGKLNQYLGFLKGMVNGQSVEFMYEFPSAKQMKKFNKLIKKAVTILNNHKQKLPNMKKANQTTA